MTKVAHFSLPLILLIVTFTSGCDKTESKLAPLSLNHTILAFGDSLTHGKGVDRANSYPAILQKMTSRPVINAGVSGETTSQGAKRLPELLDAVKPAMLILLEGGNDFIKGYNATLTSDNLEVMILAAKRRGIPVLLVGVPHKSLFSKSAELYYELARTHGLVLEDAIVKSLLLNSAMKSDTLHFNQKGYAALAQAIFDLLKENGAL